MKKMAVIYDQSIRLVLTEDGPLEEENFKSLWAAFIAGTSSDSIKEAALFICQKLNSKEVHLHTYQDYNQLIQDSNNLQDVKNKLFSQGQVMNNESYKSKKVWTSLFKKGV